MYTVEDSSNRHNIGELRALQDWYIKYQLMSVSGVAEVASLGGAIRQYQVTIDPTKLAAYNLPLQKLIHAIRASNNDVGGKVIELSETEYMVRGRGYIKSVQDIEQTVVDVSEEGTPILVRDLGAVAMGPDIKRGIADKNGTGEVVSGIVVMRFGENALDVIKSVKSKISEIEKGLPQGVTIQAAYDRSSLIQKAVATLTKQLIEEMIVVALICFLFLWHFASSLVAAITIPVGVISSFILMKFFNINANIMSLGGIAIAIGAMVDAATVFVENAHKHLERGEEKKSLGGDQKSIY